MRKIIPSTVLGAFCLAGAALAANGTPGAGIGELLASQGLRDFTLQQIAIPVQRDATAPLRIPVQLDGQSVTLLLNGYSLRADDFAVYVDDGNGLTEFPVAPPSTYRGEVLELPGSEVTGSIIDGQLNLDVLVGESSWGIQPPTDFGAPSMPGTYVVYRHDDIEELPYVCGVDDVSGVPTEDLVLEAGTGLRLCEIAFDADFPFFNLYGSVSAVVADIENVMSRVDTIYRRDVFVRFEITKIVVRSTSGSDPYTSSNPSTLLSQFRNHWNSTKAFVQKDAVHLMTGRNLTGSTIGIAYVGTICTNSGYGVSQSRFTSFLSQRAALTAHEVGHNYNADHCDAFSDCRIMCSGLGGCTGIITSFGTRAINRITAFSAGRACTPDLAKPLGLPFADDFQATSIDGNKWISYQGAATSTIPGGRGLRLDSTNPDAEGQDYIRSNEVLMLGVSEASLSYELQHRGVEVGKALTVEFLNSVGDWQVINTVLSDGVDDTSYTVFSHDLPAGAFHDSFRVQMRVNGSDSTDQWFVDDVLVDSGCLIRNVCSTSPSSSGPGAIMIGAGSTSVAADDLFLFCALGVPGQSCIFFWGPSQVDLPFGNGRLCVGAPQTRLNPPLFFDGFGEASRAFDVSATSIMPGDTSYVQNWYRDPAGGGAFFNTSDAIEIRWCP